MPNELTNPWHRLPDRPPYVLPEDLERVSEFNRRAKPEAYLHLSLIPEPFLGLPDAPIVLLGLNPGYSWTIQPITSIRRSASVRTIWPSESRYPFFLLDPTITAPGAVYWKAKLGSLTQKFGAETVVRRTLCVEFIPYHSVNFRHERLSLPSQQYSFDLSWRATKRSPAQSLWSMAGGKRFWLPAVPELQATTAYLGLIAGKPHISVPETVPPDLRASASVAKLSDGNGVLNAPRDSTLVRRSPRRTMCNASRR